MPVNKKTIVSLAVPRFAWQLKRASPDPPRLGSRFVLSIKVLSTTVSRPVNCQAVLDEPAIHLCSISVVDVQPCWPDLDLHPLDVRSG